ncbi:non-ribosomal peptide synthetase [filamentous cyanobacterium Phorm 6]|nr:non-ribosomal peptide synthetase [filamentous cyanobacterium Phorm 6]
MNFNQFLAELAERGVKLWLESDTLRFRAPKGVMTSENRELLVLHKTKVISLLSQSNTSANDTKQTLVPVSAKRDIPLSFPQEQLWFLSQLNSNNVSYNELFALRFLGVLNIVALEQSLNKIVARHAALRTNFTVVNGQPVQIIAESLTLTVPVVDLSNLPASDRENEVQRLATEQAHKPFDLVSDPLIQVTVLKLTDTEYIFLLRTHHIVWDGWSLGIMWRELAAFYNDLSQDLPPLPAEYPDFAVWQRQYLTGEVLDSLQTYWKKQLLDAPPLLELPTDRARGITQTFRGKHYRFVISKPLTEDLIGLSRQQKVTLFMTLLAAFQTLLHRYTGQTDLCVGSPIANRDRPEFKDLIGYFVNTLVLRTCLVGNPSFEDLLSRVRKVTLEAYAHRDLPFEKLVEILQPERSLSYTPLFQVMLMLLNELPDIQMEGLKVSPLAVETGIAPFDLTLSIENRTSGLIGEWEYNTNLFDDVTIAGMTGHFQTLLEGIVANPQEPISDLPLLTPAERQQLLVEWNNTAKDYPQEKCIHQLFEEQVERTPDAVAVVYQEKQLTYRELNVKANQLANYLRSQGVGPEVLVGICVERSLEMIIGLLGILKAGGAYVPLDPNYPSERLAFMLEDSSVPVLLTQQKLVEKLPQHSACVVCLDSDWKKIAVDSKENPVSSVKPKNLAYVIYTSGSTGKPKGVLIQHESLVNYTTVATAEYRIQKCDRILQFSSISFDVSAEEIYTSLTSGATLVLRTDSMLDSIKEFLQKCKNWEITVMALPTAYWHELTAFLTQETLALPPSLRLIIIGGEKALPERLKTWLEYAGQRVRLVNNYGPTEATVGATIYDLSVADTTLKELPIGRPFGNVCTYILDQNGQPVPIGIPGELHIGGAGLARGYLNRPELTTERFIRNPFNDSPTERLYKTGDQVRYLPDGNIEYLGRIDDQVKVRGFRIELGEIEAALSQHPNLLSVAVVLREDIPSQKSLVAYAVPLQEPAPTFSELRHFLKEQLPDYMVPSAFVILECLPVTPNGKVDRKSLPAPDLNSLIQKADFVAPRTPTEKLLASIWAKVLGVEKVSINDNFFESGGHSLLATQLLSKVSHTFGLNLPLSKFFEAPTVADISSYIEAISWVSQNSETSNTTINNREEVEF